MLYPKYIWTTVAVFPLFYPRNGVENPFFPHFTPKMNYRCSFPSVLPPKRSGKSPFPPFYTQNEPQMQFSFSFSPKMEWGEPFLLTFITQTEQNMLIFSDSYTKSSGDPLFPHFQPQNGPRNPFSSHLHPKWEQKSHFFHQFPLQWPRDASFSLILTPKTGDGSLFPHLCP